MKIGARRSNISALRRDITIREKFLLRLCKQDVVPSSNLFGMDASSSHLVGDVEPLLTLPVVPGVAHSRVREIIVVIAPVFSSAHANVAGYRLAFAVELIDYILAGIYGNTNKRTGGGRREGTTLRVFRDAGYMR